MFKEGAILSKYSNYRIGGPAKYFFEAKTAEELKNAITEAAKDAMPIFVLGAGTNVLFSDTGFGGLVLKPSLDYIRQENTKLVVGAGVSFAALLDCAAQKGLSGLEWAGGLPGTMGGAIRGNAGCFGGEIKDVVESVRFLQIPNPKKVKTFTNAECEFGYRDSVFRRNAIHIILEATLTLKKGDKKAIRDKIEEKIAYRAARHPMEYPNIGSIFKNVSAATLKQENIKTLKQVIKTDPFPVVPAAYLISEAGLKGVSCGGAMISSKHPNFIVNAQSATADEVKSLISLVKHGVKNKFGIELEEEVQIV